MNDLPLYSKLQMLTSESLRKELLFFVDYLLSKQFGGKENDKRRPRFGSAKGTFGLSPDFDEPLEDFNEYR